MFFLVSKDQVGQKFEIIALIASKLLFEPSHGLCNFGGIFMSNFVMNGAWQVNVAQPTIIFGKICKTKMSACFFHKVSFHLSLLYSACVIKRRAKTRCVLKWTAAIRR